MSQRDVIQCQGRTRTGARCKRRTAKTSLCYAHLELQQHLQIKKSQIPNSGLGLYTTVRRAAGRMVAPYTGRTFEKPDRSFGAPYAIQLTPDHRGPPFKYVDADRTTYAAGRYANAAKRTDHFTNNSRLRPDPANHMAKVVSIRAIPAGREVFTSYGNSYFGRH